MALEKIAKDEIERTKLECARKIETISYIVNLINSDYETFAKVFEKEINKEIRNIKERTGLTLPENSQYRQEIFEARLYVNVKQMLNELESISIEVLGAPYNYFKKVPVPETQLGFSEYIKKDGRIEKPLTEKGEKIINEYRKIKGLPNIEETKKHDKKVFECFHG